MATVVSAQVKSVKREPFDISSDKQKNRRIGGIRKKNHPLAMRKLGQLIAIGSCPGSICTQLSNKLLLPVPSDDHAGHDHFKNHRIIDKPLHAESKFSRIIFEQLAQKQKPLARHNRLSEFCFFDTGKTDKTFHSDNFFYIET